MSKKCNTCGKVLSLEMFGVDKRFKDGRDHKCKTCCCIEASDEKACKTCGKVLKLDEFYSDNRNRDGKTHQCKECHHARMYKQRLRNIQSNEENGVLIPGTKKCSTCKEVKPSSAFSRHRGTLTGLCPQCKACDSIAHSVKRERCWSENLKNNPGSAIVETKKCARCHIEKPASSFCLVHSSKTGLNSTCRECASERNKERKAKHPREAMLKSARNGAKERGIEFAITVDDIQIPERCPVFGFKMEFGGKRSTSPSIDRIDNSKGYVPGNIVVVSVKANHVKSDCTLAELHKLVNFYDSLK